MDARDSPGQAARAADRADIEDLLDGQLAAIAAVHDATIVTGNGAHFEPFEGLRVENWFT